MNEGCPMTTEELEKLNVDYMVCHCYEVNLGDIVEAIHNGYDTQEAIIYETKAGYGCERCQSSLSDANDDRDIHIDEIINYVKSKEGVG